MECNSSSKSTTRLITTDIRWGQRQRSSKCNNNSTNGRILRLICNSMRQRQRVRDQTSTTNSSSNDLIRRRRIPTINNIRPRLQRRPLPPPLLNNNPRCRRRLRRWSRSCPPPTKSIFDIEKSPFGGTSLDKLLDPIMSPANLSDVSDLGERASEVPLEPGEILDTPTTNQLFNLAGAGKSSSSTSSKSGSSMPSIGSMLGGPPDHHLPGSQNFSKHQVKREVKREPQQQPPLGSSSNGKSSRSSMTHNSSSVKTEVVKQEPKFKPGLDLSKQQDPAHTFGLALGTSMRQQAKKQTPSPTKRPISSASSTSLQQLQQQQPVKQRSLFSPPQADVKPQVQQQLLLPQTDSSTARVRTTSSSSAASDAASPSVKLSKLEQMSGYEKLKDGRTSIKVAKEDRTAQMQMQQQQQPSMKVSIPMKDGGVISSAKGSTSSSSSVASSLFEDPSGLRSNSNSGGSEHKEKKKKKKDKKEKKDKKDKDRSKNKDEAGGSNSGEKRHKHKHKDKDREKTASSSASQHHHHSSSSPAGLKLKITLPPPPPQQQQPSLKISLSGNSESSGKKRKSSVMSGGSAGGDGPASKMSRALGTPLEMENGYLQDNKLVGGGKNRHQ